MKTKVGGVTQSLTGRYFTNIINSFTGYQNAKHDINKMAYIL